MGRTPHGVRGLKYFRQFVARIVATSHPSRGAWIEIRGRMRVRKMETRRTPHGVRGLKLAA